jgi:hypothetical protein
MFLNGITVSCDASIEALGLDPLFWVTISIQAMSLWYCLWCFLFSCIPALRKMSGLTTGQVNLKEAKAAKVRMGRGRQLKKGSSVDPELDDGRGSFVPLEASPGAYE